MCCRKYNQAYHSFRQKGEGLKNRVFLFVLGSNLSGSSKSTNKLTLNPNQ
jgi:hypothetical protein